MILGSEAFWIPLFFNRKFRLELKKGGRMIAAPERPRSLRLVVQGPPSRGIRQDLRFGLEPFGRRRIIAARKQPRALRLGNDGV